jgi:predicted amidohydrolase YtcJ
VELSRDEAAVLLAVLACRADGHREAAEEAMLRSRLAGQLARLGRKQGPDAIDRLAGLLAQHGEAHTLTAIAEALPKREDRVEAMRLAGSIVLVDGSVTREEMEHLAQAGKALGVHKADLGM